jgi:hypothetical protein
VLEVALEVGPQPPPHPGDALGSYGQRMRGLVPQQRGAQQLARALQHAGVRPRGAGLAAQVVQHVAQRGVRERAARERLGLGLEVACAQQSLDEPPRRAAGPGFQRGGRPERLGAQLRQDVLVTEGGQSFPARCGRCSIAGRPWLGGGRTIHPLPHLTQRAPAASAVQVAGEEVADIVHEQRARTLQAVVVGGVPAQHEQLPRACDGGVEQVALGGQGVLAATRLAGEREQAGAFDQAPTLVLGEQRLGVGGRREDAFLQTAQEQRPHIPGAQRERVEHGDGVTGRLFADGRLQAAEGRDQGVRVGGEHGGGRVGVRVGVRGCQLEQLGERRAGEH